MTLAESYRITSMALCKIDLFSAENPCRILEFRPLTKEEEETRPWNVTERIHGICDKLVKTIANPVDAAFEVVDGKYLSHIESYAKEYCNQQLVKWRQYMPTETPRSVLTRRNAYGKRDDVLVSSDVAAYGMLPPNGQVLFHAGMLPWSKTVKLERPLSTSLSPCVAWLDALRNAPKATDPILCVYVLTVIRPTTKVFVYDHKRSNLSHGLEVLFNSGACIENQCIVGDIPKNIVVDYMRGLRRAFCVKVVTATIS